MLSYLPWYYSTSRVMQTLMSAEGAELEEVRSAIDQVLDQFFVKTADWSLVEWEEQFGLPITPDLPDSMRREKITSRIRGQGTAVVQLVKSVAEAYENGQIAVVEDFPAYKVIVRFIDTTGVPPNMGEDLKAALRAVVPAHLELLYEYNYLVWYEMDEQNWTWNALDAKGLNWNGLEVYA